MVVAGIVANVEIDAGIIGDKHPFTPRNAVAQGHWSHHQSDPEAKGGELHETLAAAAVR